MKPRHVDRVGSREGDAWASEVPWGHWGHVLPAIQGSVGAFEDPDGGGEVIGDDPDLAEFVRVVGERLVEADAADGRAGHLVPRLAHVVRVVDVRILGHEHHLAIVPGVEGDVHDASAVQHGRPRRTAVRRSDESLGGARGAARDRVVVRADEDHLRVVGRRIDLTVGDRASIRPRRQHRGPGIAFVLGAHHAHAVDLISPEPGWVLRIDGQLACETEATARVLPARARIGTAEQAGEPVGWCVERVGVAGLHQDLEHVAAEEVAAVPLADARRNGERIGKGDAAAVRVDDGERVAAGVEPPGHRGCQGGAVDPRDAGQGRRSQRDRRGGYKAAAGDGNGRVDVVGP